MRSDRVAEVDAQITTEEELEKQLKALDAVGTDEARRLQAVLKTIWEWRQRRANGRKIRRVADLEADIRKKTEQMRADSKKLQDETSEYISEYYGYGAEVEREQGIAGDIREEPERKEKGAGPRWIQKYRERIGKGTITAEDILEEENKIREKPVKLSTVTKAIKTMGYPITGLRKEKEE